MNKKCFNSNVKLERKLFDATNHISHARSVPCDAKLKQQLRTIRAQVFWEISKSSASKKSMEISTPRRRDGISRERGCKWKFYLLNLVGGRELSKLSLWERWLQSSRYISSTYAKSDILRIHRTLKQAPNTSGKLDVFPDQSALFPRERIAILMRNYQLGSCSCDAGARREVIIFLKEYPSRGTTFDSNDFFCDAR